MVQEQIDLAISNLMTWNALLAVLCLSVACAGSWHFWELAYVEKKAAKHKRRRRQRKNSIPWDKINASRPADAACVMRACVLHMHRTCTAHCMLYECVPP